MELIVLENGLNKKLCLIFCNDIPLINDQDNIKAGWNLHSNSAFSRVKFQIVVLGASFEKSKKTKIIVVSITLYIMNAPQMVM